MLPALNLRFFEVPWKLSDVERDKQRSNLGLSLHDSWHLSQRFVVVLQAFLCFWTCLYLQFWNARTFESLPNLVQVCSLLLALVPVQNFQAEPESMLAAFSPECFGFCLKHNLIYRFFSPQLCRKFISMRAFVIKCIKHYFIKPEKL